VDTAVVPLVPLGSGLSWEPARTVGSRRAHEVAGALERLDWLGAVSGWVESGKFCGCESGHGQHGEMREKHDPKQLRGGDYYMLITSDS